MVDLTLLPINFKFPEVGVCWRTAAKTFNLAPLTVLVSTPHAPINISWHFGSFHLYFALSIFNEISKDEAEIGTSGLFVIQG